MKRLLALLIILAACSSPPITQPEQRITIIGVPVAEPDQTPSPCTSANGNLARPL